MTDAEPKMFVENAFAKVLGAITTCTADLQARLIHRSVCLTYDRSECCATAGILVASAILLGSWTVPTVIWWAVLLRVALALLALWWAAGAFFYPVKVVLVDLPAGGELKSPTRSIILLFFNYVEVTIHFASVYLLSSSIAHSGCQNPITCPLESLYFSIVTITTLGYGDIRPISWMGRGLVSLEVLVGVALIVTALARFLSESVGITKGDNSGSQTHDDKK